MTKFSEKLYNVTQKHQTDQHLPSDKQFPMADSWQQINTTLYRPILHRHITNSSVALNMQPFPPGCTNGINKQVVLIEMTPGDNLNVFSTFCV